MKNKKLLVLLSTLFLTFSAASCSVGPKTPESSEPESSQSESSEETIAVTSVELNKTELSLDVDEEETLQHTVLPANASNTRVTWSSDAEAVATVTQSGKVVAVAPGVAHIKVQSQADETKFATCTVTVNKRKVLIIEENPQLNVAYKLGAYQENLSKDIYWNGVVSTDGNGRGATSDKWDEGVDVHFENAETTGKYLVSIGSGETKKYLSTASSSDYHLALKDEADATEWTWNATYSTITVKVGSKTYFPATYNNYDTMTAADFSYVKSDFVFKFQYKVDECDPETITLNKTAATVHADERLQLEAKLGPVGAVGEVAWTVEGNDKVTVNNSGLVAVAADAVVGSTATVKATIGELSASATITVAEAYNYGSAADPLDPEEAKALIDVLVEDGFNYSSHKLYVQGIAETNTAYDSEAKTHKEVWLTNNDGSEAKYFELYGVEYASTLTPVTAANGLRGKVITAVGYATFYAPSSIYELTSSNNTKPQITAMEDGVRNVVTVDLLNGSETVSDPISVEQGQSVTLSYDAKPYGSIDNTGATWAVEGNDKVTVENGVVSVAADAVIDSTATIKCTVGSVVATATISVAEALGQKISITAANLLGYEGTNVAYNTERATKTIDDITFSYIQLGAYGSGIQMRYKNSVGSEIHNTTAFGKGIGKIVITLNASQQVSDNTDVWEFKYGTTADLDSYSAKLSTVADVKEYTVRPDAKTYTYFSMEKVLQSFSFYVDSIEIYLVK